LGGDENLSPEEVERGRLNEEWKKFVQLDQPTEKASTPNTEKWTDISMENVNNKKQYTPLSGDVSGSSVFRVQLLLDRTQFSPGIIDGKWGKNTEKAVYWLQKREGIPANGQVDQKTYQRFIELAGSPDKLITEQQLSEKDVSGPFVKIPADIYEKAKMDCMCYESLTEKLSEKYHISPELLQKLNPNVKLDELKAGDKIIAPNLRASEENSKKDVERIIVSDGGHYVHGLDAQGKILSHYPSTLGSDYNPSPSGEYKINSVTENPSWHYQPELLDGGGGKDAMIPPGPNNAVGLVWMDLSKPHYGIHGTSAPETIGYATSHGCIRLTNWDALALGRRVKPGTPVEFNDLANRSDKKETE
jgi:lipoprotein-anchoring transpeptidase ErfK/SrfK